MIEKDWRFEVFLTTALAYTQEAERKILRAGIKGEISDETIRHIAFHMRDAAKKIEKLGTPKGTDDD